MTDETAETAIRHYSHLRHGLSRSHRNAKNTMIREGCPVLLTMDHSTDSSLSEPFKQTDQHHAQHPQCGLRL